MMANPQLRNFAAQVALTAAASAATVKAVDSATDYIYVTRFVITITVVANGKKTTMTDSAASPIVFATYTDLTVASGLSQTGYVSYDFGKRGLKLTLGKNLTVTSEASGSAGWAYAEGYQAAS
jgi:hypothetical protein